MLRSRVYRPPDRTHSYVGRLATWEAPAGENLREALAEALVSVAASLIAPLFAALTPRAESLIALLVDVRAVAGVFGRAQNASLTEALATLPPWARALYKAIPIKDAAPRKLREAYAQRVAPLLGTASEQVLNAVVPVLIASGERPIAAIERWLGSATSTDGSRRAAQAAADVGAAELIGLALGHEWASARAVALRASAPPNSARLSASIVRLATDPSSQVRLVLVDLLARSRDRAHKQALLRLARDTWSSADAFYEEEPVWLIARKALAALATYDALSVSEGEALIAIALDTPDDQVRALTTRIAGDLGPQEIR